MTIFTVGKPIYEAMFMDALPIVAGNQGAWCLAHCIARVAVGISGHHRPTLVPGLVVPYR